MDLPDAGTDGVGKDNSSSVFVRKRSIWDIFNFGGDDTADGETTVAPSELTTFPAWIKASFSFNFTTELDEPLGSTHNAYSFPTPSQSPTPPPDNSPSKPVWLYRFVRSGSVHCSVRCYYSLLSTLVQSQPVRIPYATASKQHRLNSNCYKLLTVQSVAILLLLRYFYLLL